MCNEGDSVSKELCSWQGCQIIEMRLLVVVHNKALLISCQYPTSTVCASVPGRAQLRNGMAAIACRPGLGI